MLRLLEFAVAAPSVVNGAAVGSDPRLHLGQTPGYVWADPRLHVQWPLLWELRCRRMAGMGTQSWKRALSSMREIRKNKSVTE